MTDYAIPGESHSDLPAWVEEWSIGFRYVVLPWRCPRCDQVIGTTVVDDRGVNGMRALTMPVEGAWVRIEKAERDGLPFFGPSSRERKGKTPRRRPVALRREATARAWAQKMGGDAPPVDHAPVEAIEFDTLCTNCPLPLRVRIPPLT